MILSELKSIKELNLNMADGYILNVSHLSSPSDITMSINKVNEVVKATSKPVFLKLNLLYMDKDYVSLEEVFKNVKGIKGMIFQDFGLIPLKEKYNKDLVMIYDSSNFITTSLDYLYFKNSGVDTLTLSNTLTLKELDEVVNTDYSYAAHAYGYQEMFYSYRKHFTNYSKEYGFKDLKDKYNISLKEETRDQLFKTVEDENGFYIFRDKLINIYDFMDHFKKCDYLILDRLFINDEEYLDTVKLYKGITSRSEYISKYNSPF
nr:U32 family peptidase [Gammaproteobacteria bacterium]